VVRALPGLIVVCPGTPYDAKGLLTASIRNDNPVIYFEHKKLYRSVKAEVPEDDYVVPIGKAEVRRPGDDITLVAYSLMLHKSLEAAERAAKKGIEVEVIDLRTIYPWDKDRVLESVKKTGRLLVVHETSARAASAARSRRPRRTKRSSISTRRSSASRRPRCHVAVRAGDGALLHAVGGSDRVRDRDARSVLGSRSRPWRRAGRRRFTWRFRL